MRGDNLLIVDLSKYNADGKEAKYIQINHIVGKLITNKKTTEDHIKKAEFQFMMDLKTVISKTAIDPELTRVRNSMRREDRETIPKGYRTALDKVSIRWGLIFVDDQIVVPIDIRRRILDILHFGLRYNRNDLRSEDILVAGNETRHREQSQGLHRMSSIR